MNISDEIKRLHELHQAGALTDEEFAQAKAKLLDNINGAQAGNNASSGSAGSHGENPFAQLNYLRRSKSDQWLGGVCAGLGKFTGMESWIWRLIFVIFVCFFGIGIVAYLLAWVFVPEEE